MWTGPRCGYSPAILLGLALLLALSSCGRSTRREATAHGSAGEDPGKSGGSAGDSSTGGSTAGQSGGGNGGTNVSGGGGAGGGGARAGSGGEGGGAVECILAWRVACCAEYVAVSRAELEANECLVAVGSELDAVAFERCSNVDTCAESCGEPLLPSHLVEPDESGGCRFADECQTEDDCQVAVDCCTCCACSGPVPKSFARSIACFVPTSDPPEPDDWLPDMCQVCGGALCAPCEVRDGTFSCNPTPLGLRRCEWGPPLSASQCNVERPCVNGNPGQNLRCYAPGAVYCGGPAPPPDECAVDGDCQTEPSRAHFVCEPSGHCSARECVAGCLADEDCSIAEQCGADHRCAPKPCSSEVCGRDHYCSPDGTCARKACTSSRYCGGHCINGYCYAQAGVCFDANAP